MFIIHDGQFIYAVGLTRAAAYRDLARHLPPSLIAGMVGVECSRCSGRLYQMALGGDWEGVTTDDWHMANGVAVLKGEHRTNLHGGMAV